MNQVGDQVTLMVSPVPTGTMIYSYVWNFWDGTSTATEQPFVVKVINIGGHPGTDALLYTCRPVAVDGQSVVLYGSIAANGPPTIIYGSISDNDNYFSYTTQLSVTAIDQDGDTFDFLWYSGTTPLGSGAVSAVGMASGTWMGNGETVIANYPASQSVLTTVVSSDRDITCKVVDVRSGTAVIDFALRGSPNPPPVASLAAGFTGLSADSSTPPIARIGPGQTVDFTVYAAPMPTHDLSFSWNFSGSLGWTMDPHSSVGTTTVLENGGYQNTVHRDISAEVVSTGTSKGVVAEVRVLARNKTSGQITHADVDYEVTLIANTDPSSVVVSRVVNNAYVNGVGPVVAGSKIEFSGTGHDDNNDVLTYKWSFAQPFAPSTVHFWGPKVLYDTSGYSSAQIVQGQLHVYDAMGGTLSTLLPTTNIL